LTYGSGIDDAATWEQAEMAAVLVAAGAAATSGDWVRGSCCMLTHA
jgi:hypothetical protein